MRQQQTSASAERGPAAAHSADEGAGLQACDCALCNVAALSAVSRIPGARLIADGPFVDACSACATAQGSGQCLPAASAQGSPSLRSVTIEGLPVPDLLPLVEAVAQHYPGLQSLQITPDKQPAPASAQTAQRTQSQSYNTPERVSGLLASLPALSSLRHLRCIAPQTSLEVEVPAVWPAGTVSAHLSVRDPRYYVEQLAAMQTWIRQVCVCVCVLMSLRMREGPLLHVHSAAFVCVVYVYVCVCVLVLWRVRRDASFLQRSARPPGSHFVRGIPSQPLPCYWS